MSTPYKEPERTDQSPRATDLDKAAEILGRNKGTPPEGMSFEDQHFDEEGLDAAREPIQSQEHTPEPWKINIATQQSAITDGSLTGNLSIRADDKHGSLIVDFGEKDNEVKRDAVRIVACVNYCAGLSNAELESDAISMKSKAGILTFTPEEAAYLLAAGQACSKAGLADPGAEIKRLLSRENAVIVEQQAEIEGLRVRITELEAAIRQSNFPDEGHFPDLT